jgi:N-6 DNA Methylase
MNLQEIEDRVAQLDRAEGPGLIYSLLLAYGLPKAGIARLRSGTYNRSTVSGETLWKGRVFDRYEANGADLHAAIDTVGADERVQREHPRFVIVRDAARLLALDTFTRDTLDIGLSELHSNAAFFLPWAGIEKQQLESLHYADVKAAQRMALLYEEIIKANTIETEQDIHRLNVFFARLLFCFFAEDTDVFPKGAFTDAIASLTNPLGEDVASFLDELFKVLDTPEDQRADVPSHFLPFGYVNGKLFSTSAPAPRFSSKARGIVIESGALNWSQINPDIFGSMMQAVVQRGERQAFGMHYTSVENILKVIRPLFLDSLDAELTAADTVPKLRRFIARLSEIRVFDPACGSGNFLIIAYKELRRREHRALQQIAELDPASATLFTFSEIQLESFYGIEIDDFAHEVAMLSLWLAKHQMNVEFRELFGAEIPLIPLRDAGNLVSGNAPRIDWENVCPKGSVGELYVIGNPPYAGSSMQTTEQRAEFVDYFGTSRYPKNLDYIALWFLKGARYIADGRAQLGFVTTNSVSQGDHVGLMWPLIYAEGAEVAFAYQSFPWSNQARGNAGVTCAIIGLGQAGDRALDVRCRDVAEDAADEHQVGWDRALVGVGERRIAGDYLHPVEPSLLRGTAREEHVVLVELDQARTDVPAPLMIGERPDEIVSLPRAYAHHLDRAGWHTVQPSAHLLLHEHEALGEPRVGLLVGVVPCSPVHDERLRGDATRRST